MPHTAPGSFPPLQNLPRFWTSTRNVVVVPDTSKSRKQFNRDIKDEVGTIIRLLLGEKSIADGLHFLRGSPGRVKMFDTLLGVMENGPALHAIRPRTGVTV